MIIQGMDSSQGFGFQSKGGLASKWSFQARVNVRNCSPKWCHAFAYGLLGLPNVKVKALLTGLRSFTNFAEFASQDFVRNLNPFFVWGCGENPRSKLSKVVVVILLIFLVSSQVEGCRFTLGVKVSRLHHKFKLGFKIRVFPRANN